MSRETSITGIMQYLRAYRNEMRPNFLVRGVKDPQNLFLAFLSIRLLHFPLFIAQESVYMYLISFIPDDFCCSDIIPSLLMTMGGRRWTDRYLKAGYIKILVMIAMQRVLREPLKDGTSVTSLFRRCLCFYPQFGP